MRGDRTSSLAMPIVAFAVMGAVWLMTAARAGFELPTPDEVVGKVKGVYARHCCFRAAFDQITVNVAMDMRDRFQGVMYVKKPGLIALDVVSPEKQHVVVQGRSYSVYFPEERSAVRGEVPPEINVEHFFNFFANIGNIEQNFSVSYPAKAFSPEEGLIFLELHDTKNPQGTFRIILGVDSTTYIIHRAVIYDALGNYNRFHLSEVKFLDTIPDSRFRTEYEGTSTLPSSPLQLFDDRDKR